MENTWPWDTTISTTLTSTSTTTTSTTISTTTTSTTTPYYNDDVKNIAAIVAPTVIFSVLAIIIIWFWFYRRHKKKPNAEIISHQNEDIYYVISPDQYSNDEPIYANTKCNPVKLPPREAAAPKPPSLKSEQGHDNDNSKIASQTTPPESPERSFSLYDHPREPPQPATLLPAGSMNNEHESNATERTRVEPQVPSLQTLRQHMRDNFPSLRDSAGSTSSSTTIQPEQQTSLGDDEGPMDSFHNRREFWERIGTMPTHQYDVPLHARRLSDGLSTSTSGGSASSWSSESSFGLESIRVVVKVRHTLSISPATDERDQVHQTNNLSVCMNPSSPLSSSSREPSSSGRDAEEEERSRDRHSWASSSTSENLCDVDEMFEAMVRNIVLERVITLARLFYFVMCTKWYAYTNLDIGRDG